VCADGFSGYVNYHPANTTTSITPATTPADTNPVPAPAPSGSGNVIDPTCYYGNPIYNSAYNQTFCSCYSGYSSIVGQQNCTTKSYQGNCTLSPVQYDSVSFTPSLQYQQSVDGNFAQFSLSLPLEVSAVDDSGNNAQATSVRWSDRDTACDFPGPLWHNYSSGCSDSFVGQMNWNTLLKSESSVFCTDFYFRIVDLLMKFFEKKIDRLQRCIY
jgi:hypothetical protein